MHFCTGCFLLVLYINTPMCVCNTLSVCNTFKVDTSPKFKRLRANAVSRSHVVQIANISTTLLKTCTYTHFINNNQSKLKTKQWVLFFLTTNQKWETNKPFFAPPVVKFFYSELQKKTAGHEEFSLYFEDENKRKEGIKAVRHSSLVSKSLFDSLCIRNVS